MSRSFQAETVQSVSEYCVGATGRRSVTGPLFTGLIVGRRETDWSC